MKKLLAMLLTLALLCATGIAMAAEAVLPDTIPTITVDISADGNVTLKTSDGKTDYDSVYARKQRELFNQQSQQISEKQK